MRKFLLTFICLLSNILLLFAQGIPGKWGDQGNGTYINPILNADYSDPDVIRVGAKYYMVASEGILENIQIGTAKMLFTLNQTGIEGDIRNIVIDNFHVKKALYPYYMKCAKEVRLKDVSVNGEYLPEGLKEHKDRVTLDVY